MATRPTEHHFPITLTDYTQQSGIDFVHQYYLGGDRYIIETVGGSIASFDFDLDGWIDVYFLNGSPLPFDPKDVSPNCLYRNRGEFRFQNVTAFAHCGAEEFGMGVVAADYNNDGFPDLFVNNFGANRLYRNNGDGTFDDVASAAGVSVSDRMGAGTTFFDANRDGNLDLYVANYVKSPIELNVKRTTDGTPSYPGPSDFHGENDVFFLSLGDGTFADRTDAAGMGGVALTSMGVVAADFDDDGDDDLVVVVDVDRNLFFKNDGTGVFEEIGVRSGIAFSKDGRRNGNMGVDIGDYNQDGHLDIYTTTFSNELPVLYRNDGLANFEDVTQAAGAGKGLFPHSNWGLAFFDIENDRDKDLFVANGHTDPQVGSWSYTTSWKVANTVFANDGKGHFENVSTLCGSGLIPVESSRGLVAEDFDNDGDQDLIISNSLAKPTVIRNDSLSRGHWLQVELIGLTNARDGVGARVTVKTESGSLVDQVVSGRGFQCSFGNRMHFGLGSDSKVDEITIRWTDGSIQRIEPTGVDAILKIQQQKK
jgi:enediyne biosynthesis protein E4